MSIDLGTETTTLTLKERTWKMELLSELNEDWQLVAHRERIKVDQTGMLVDNTRNIPEVRRALSKIADQTFTVGTQTFTGRQLATIISAVVDQLRQEDIAAGK